MIIPATRSKTMGPSYNISESRSIFSYSVQETNTHGNLLNCGSVGSDKLVIDARCIPRPYLRSISKGWHGYQASISSVSYISSSWKKLSAKKVALPLILVLFPHVHTCPRLGSRLGFIYFQPGALCLESCNRS